MAISKNDVCVQDCNTGLKIVRVWPKVDQHTPQMARSWPTWPEWQKKINKKLPKKGQILQNNWPKMPKWPRQCPRARRVAEKKNGQKWPWVVSNGQKWVHIPIRVHFSPPPLTVGDKRWWSLEKRGGITIHDSKLTSFLEMAVLVGNTYINVSSSKNPVVSSHSHSKINVLEPFCFGTNRVINSLLNYYY